MTAPAVGYAGAAHRRVAIVPDATADPAPVAVTLQALYQRTANEHGVPGPRSGLYGARETATFHGHEAAALIAAGAAVLA